MTGFVFWVFLGFFCRHCIDESEQLRQLEEQQEQLNSYLQALTTHFAQVQFRLKQTVNAPPEEKEVSKLNEQFLKL